MEQKLLKIVSNVPLTDQVFMLTLDAEGMETPKPGQFVNIKIGSLFLRRPISVCDFSDGKLTLIIKKVGEGTEILSGMKSGPLDVLTGLGNGYDLSLSPRSPLLVGGGVGVPPLYFLAKKLIEEKISPRVVLGFNTAGEIFFRDEFAALGVPVKVTTADGTEGIKGFVTDAMEGGEYVFACGPEPMLKAVYKKSSGGQFSFEERMGCGFGACMGCSCRTVTGYKRICRDGPVLRREEILWTD
ncbi:MAG: dihydroorotate dehydrogenase electron transfer subunit [Clostridia bacterium]|nr:dihydroorotate dehydrogenase electron transfer subunit [Clostridia bacterium]